MICFMETPRTSIFTTGRVPRPLVRMVAAGAFVIAFFALTSIIDPSQSTARDSMGPERGDLIGPVLGGGGMDPTERMLSSLPSDASVLGTLESRQHTIIITAGELEPRYSVFSPEGDAKFLEATLTELYELAPDLDVAGMMAGSDAFGGVDQGVPIDLDGGWLR
jgi:hypothetical protein